MEVITPLTINWSVVTAAAVSISAVAALIQLWRNRTRVAVVYSLGVNPHISSLPPIIQILATNKSARPITIVAVGYDGLGKGHVGLLPPLLTAPNGYSKPALPAYLVEGQVLNAWFPDYLADLEIPDVYLSLWVQDSNGRRHYTGRGLKAAWRRRKFRRMSPQPAPPQPPPTT